MEIFWIVNYATDDGKEAIVFFDDKPDQDQIREYRPNGFRFQGKCKVEVENGSLIPIERLLMKR